MRFDILTHLNHAFAWPLADGSIAGYSNLDHPELIQATHNAGRKILISLGGFGQSQYFSPMAADAVARANFVKNIVNYVELHEYDGADFDWEFPQTAADRANLTTLVKEVREAFDNENPDWLVTMVAVATDFNGQWHNYAALAVYVDWFNLMAYDFHGIWTNHAGHNAPLYSPPTDFDGSGHQGVQYLNINRRIPKEQIHLGLPFYGREFNASRLYGPSTGGGEVVYSSIAPRQSSSWDYFWDEVSKVPYLLDAHRTKFVTFDDSLSLSFKCEYAKANGLAGVMIWALGQDILADTQSLVEAVGRAMAKTTGVAAEKNQNVEGFELFGNYPNPFNASTTIAFQLGQEVPVKVFIYDLHGNLVAVIKNDVVSSGRHAMTWDATGFASGIYFYKLEAAGFRDMKKMILAK
ncbi:glycosyl hydrolase family 18 protein [candidate division KSB1 bacterium]|nr:glycosyl hydrolase family 18 protein [candidate division KSB1 bacterium]